MMFNTKMFVPRYDRFKLHSEAQIGSGVRQQDDQVPTTLGNADYVPKAGFTIKIFFDR